MYNSYYNIIDLYSCWIKPYVIMMLVRKSCNLQDYCPYTLFYSKLQFIKNRNPKLDSFIHGLSSTPSISLVETFHAKKSLCLPSTMGLSRLETWMSYDYSFAPSNCHSSWLWYDFKQSFQLLNLDILPPISTFRILSTSWDNFSTLGMKNLIKQSREV
jgi:hypothetical protein